MIDVQKASVASSDATRLIQELSEELTRITGSSGNDSFQISAMENQRAAFFIAYKDGEPVGCGAIQKYTKDIAEIKRVYSQKSGIGIGTAIIAALEKEAKKLRYHTIILETRKVNHAAVRFYLHNKYQVIENYGKYIGQDKAICFMKKIE